MQIFYMNLQFPSCMLHIPPDFLSRYNHPNYQLSCTAFGRPDYVSNKTVNY